MFRFDLPMTWRELGFLLFARKRCPVCVGPLQRMTTTRDEGPGWHRDGGDFEYAHTTSVAVEYECRRCGAWYTLTDLATRHRR